MNYPLARDSFVGPCSSSGCCIGNLNARQASCQLCSRPLVQIHQYNFRGSLLASSSYQSVLARGRGEVGGAAGAINYPAPRSSIEWHSSWTGPRYQYHTHPLRSSSSTYSLNRSPSRNRSSGGLAGEAVGQRSPGARQPRQPSAQEFSKWIGEDTRRSLPQHVYKYYLAQTKEFRRQKFKVK